MKLLFLFVLVMCFQLYTLCLLEVPYAFDDILISYKKILWLRAGLNFNLESSKWLKLK